MEKVQWNPQEVETHQHFSDPLCLWDALKGKHPEIKLPQVTDLYRHVFNEPSNKVTPNVIIIHPIPLIQFPNLHGHVPVKCLWSLFLLTVCKQIFGPKSFHTKNGVTKKICTRQEWCPKCVPRDHLGRVVHPISQHWFSPTVSFG